MVYDKAQKSFFADDHNPARRPFPRFKPRQPAQDAGARGASAPPVQICSGTIQKLTSYALTTEPEAVADSGPTIQVQETSQTPARQVISPAVGKESIMVRSSQSDTVHWKPSPFQHGGVSSTEKLTIDEVYEIYGGSPGLLAAQTPIRKRPAVSPAGELWARSQGQQVSLIEFDLSPQAARSPMVEKNAIRRATSLPPWTLDNDSRKRRKLNEGHSQLKGLMEQVEASYSRDETELEKSSPPDMAPPSMLKASTPKSNVAKLISAETIVDFDSDEFSSLGEVDLGDLEHPNVAAQTRKVSVEPQSDHFSDSIDNVSPHDLQQLDVAVQESISTAKSAQKAAKLQDAEQVTVASDKTTCQRQVCDDSDIEFAFAGMNDDDLLEATQHLEQQYQATQRLECNLPHGLAANATSWPNFPTDSCQNMATLAAIHDDNDLLTGIDEEEFADFDDEDLLTTEDHSDVSIHTVIATAQRSCSLHGKTFQELVLQIKDSSDRPKTAFLRDDWIYAQINAGDTIRLHGLWESPLRFVASSTSGLVIVHPDILVSATSVADAHNCMRKAVLQDRVKATSQLSLPLLYGSMLHEILQQSLVVQDFGDKAMRRVVESQIARNMESLYLLDQAVETAKDYLYEKMLLIQQWAHKYVGVSTVSAAEPMRGQGVNKSRLQQVALGVKSILEIEERFWSPIWGLKGNVDVTATMNVAVDNERAIHAAPLEFKTGNATRQQGSHRAQTMLYTLMMSDRYGIPVTAGYLYYLETCQVIRVTALHNEVRGLLQMRNDVASFIKNKKLPDMLRNPFACKNCYASEACFTYHRAFDQGTGETSGLERIFEEKVEHLTVNQLAWFNKWEQLITKEEGDMYKFRHELWQLSSKEREGLHRCFGHLRIVPDSEVQSPDASKMTQWTYQLSRHTPGATFHDSQIAERDPIVISDEAGHYALSCGFVSRITPTRITVEVDRPLRDSRSPLDGFEMNNKQVFRGTGTAETQENTLLYRLDKDEFKNGMAMVRNNLIQLLLQPESKQATVSTERLRELIVDLAPPSFDKKALTCPDRESQSTLNVDQIRTKEKVLQARDYALVLGMPGTGKTTTIATIIKSLVAAGKSVLLTSYTHSAVDTILLKLKSDVKILRLGSVGKIHPEVLSFASTETHNLETFEDLERHYDEPSVVATTCLSIQHAIFQKRRFDYCIVDEASQITLPVCLGPLRFADKFLLVGDHYQLPPLVKDKEALAGGLDISLFKALSDAHPEAVVNLEHQYRMNADIMSIANELIYSGKLKCGTPLIAEQRLHVDMARILKHLHAHNQCSDEPCWIGNVLAPSRNVVFLNTNDIPEARETKRGDQIQNATESALIAQVIAGLAAGGIPEASIGVISPYRSQLKLLHVDLSAFPGVLIDTADKFQGRDRDCILVSFVRSNQNGQVGELLKDWRRINVALTRAKRKLICVGSQETLANDPLLNQFLHLVHRRGWAIDLPRNAHLQHVQAAAATSPGKLRSPSATTMSEANKENQRIRSVGRAKSVFAGERALFKQGARPILRDLKNAMNETL